MSVVEILVLVFQNSFETESQRMETANSPTSDLKSPQSRKLLEILLRQNSQMEREIQRLNAEIDEISKGVVKRGYLHKFRDREISYASRWGLRYFVLQGKCLSYYIDDRDLRPRRTIDLSGCIVRDEGEKKNGNYHVFGIYWPSTPENSDGGGNLLMRLSSESKAEAIQWILMLQSACRSPEEEKSMLASNQEDADSQGAKPKTASTSAERSENSGSDSLDSLVTDEVPFETLQRVRSSSRILQKSQSRQSFSRLDELVSPKDKEPNKSSKTSSKKSRDHKFPASKPIHVESKHSPLSSEARAGEQNYRGFFNLVIK